ncbi:hypothetical protein [Pontibacter pamirensis]|uniref:hypothetical protein n=1 Tax=Pontibacter pamirensis TaxID=2562824 RepID=UPI00138A485C|nr:hypothetical protein [Pontibacter pamirensis]
MRTKQKPYQFAGKLASSTATDGRFIKVIWLLWVLILTVALVIQLITLDVLPHLQQDEAQITDYGRLALNPTSDWSVTWRLGEGKPLLLWSYLGPLIAEISYQIGGTNGLGPRLASLIGGMIAATIAFGWLLARRVPIYVAFCLSLAFMLDPLFVLSQRMARVDSWVVALCLASCWLLRVTLAKDGDSLNKWRFIAAGGLAAAAALVWPSAVFLYPLIVLEFFQSGEAENAEVGKVKLFASKALYFGFGGVAMFILLLLPVWQNLVIIFSDMSTMVSQNIDSSKTLSERLFSLFDPQVWLKLIKALVKTFTPLFPLLAIAGIIVHREKGLILASFITLTMIFASLVYEFRVLYLIPYFVALSSGIFVYLKESVKSNRWLKKVSILALGVVTLWSVGTSLLVRTVLGLEGKTERDRNKIYHVAASSIGPGNYKVFLGFTYEFYFVGRSLGWQLYTPYIQFSYDSEGNWIRENDYQPKDKFHKLLSQMDFAVFAEGSVDEELSKDLAVSGLKYSGSLRVGEEQGSTESPQLRERNKEVFLWFLQGRMSYGPYVLYAREKSDKISLNSE